MESAFVSEEPFRWHLEPGGESKPALCIASVSSQSLLKLEGWTAFNAISLARFPTLKPVVNLGVAYRLSAQLYIMH